MDPSNPGLNPRQERLLLLILAGVQFSHIMDFMIIMPLGPQLMRLFAITPREFGFLVAAYTFAAGATGFLSAFIADRFDRKKFLLVAYVGFTLGTLACGLAPNYFFLLIARSLAGVFGGAMGGQLMAIIGDVIPFQRRGRAMGLTMASFSVASVFGVPFGLFLATELGWHAPFFFVGFMAALITVMILVKVPSMTRHMEDIHPNHNPIHLLGGIVRDRNQLRALLLTFTMLFGQFSMIPFLSPYLVSNVGLLESQLPWVYFLGGGLTIFTSPIVGRLADRFGKPRMFAISGAFMLIPIVVLPNLGATAVPIALLVTTLFFIFSNGRFIPAIAMITSTVRPATRGGFMSINSSVQSLSSGCAALFAGLVVSRAPSGQLMRYDVVGYVSFALALVAIFIGRKLRPVDDSVATVS